MVWVEDDCGHVSKDYLEGEVGARPMIGDTLVVLSSENSLRFTVVRVEVLMYPSVSAKGKCADVAVYCKRR